MPPVKWALLLAALLVTLPVDGDTAPEVWIVSGPGALEAADLLPATQVHVYEHLEMLAILATPAMAAQIERLGYDVHPNEVYDLHLEDSVPYIRADQVQKAVGSARSHATVLVIDTGLSAGHPAFPESAIAANVRADRSANGLVSGALENVPITDRSGHGTHVAGIVASSGQGYPGDPDAGAHKGVYQNGRVASFQAATDATDPEDIAVDLQAALEGYEWAMANQDRYKIRVITNSWGSAGDVLPDHPASRATLRAYAAGMVVVFSAGNDGEPGSLNKHCLPTWVLCVAAGTLDGTRSSFSSMGHEPGDELGPYDHPDLTAPGSSIHSSEPADPGTLQTRSAFDIRSGTSMAAPHVAATAGLLLAARPDLSPDQVMDILVGTTRPMSEEPWRVGSGYLDALAAYNLALRTPGQLDAFLSGDGVKYAGPATGDADFADDPVSVGYASESGGALDAATIIGPTEPWLLTSWVPTALLALALLFVLIGTRWRRPRDVDVEAATT